MDPIDQECLMRLSLNCKAAGLVLQGPYSDWTGNAVLFQCVTAEEAAGQP